MKFLVSAAFLSLLITSSSQAQIVYSEGFDSEASAKVIQRAMADTEVRYVDYSEFSVGGEAFEIPEAPNKAEDSETTQGVFFQANLSSASPNAINLTAADEPGGTPITFTGTYRLTFDVYISVADPIPIDGSTEQVMWSIGTTTDVIQGRAQRTDALNSGIWGWIAGEGGYGTEDSVIYVDAELIEKKDNINHAELWQTAFPDDRPVPSIPANAWTQVTIEAYSDRARVLYNGVLFHEAPINPDTATGFAMVGYEDPFGSLSGEPNFQWGLIDNFIIEAFAEPALELVDSVAFDAVADEGVSSASTLTVANRRDVPLTILSSSVSGPNADAFAVSTALPVVIPARSTTNLAVDFTPGTLGGVRTASLELATDDAETPTITLPLEASRLGLLAHYKLDETSGSVMADASGNGIDGRFLAADGGEVALGATGLASGTGIMIDPRGESGLAVAEVPATAAIPNLPTFSISMWFQLDPRDIGTGSVLFGRGTALEQSGALVLLAESSEQPLQWIVDSSGGVTTAGDLVKTETPYHLVFSQLDSDPTVEGADRIRVYLNGTLAEEIDTVDEVFTYTSDAVFQFGGFQGTSGLTGLLDDLQIYSKELSEQEVAFLFSNPGTAIGSGGGGVEPDVDTDGDGLTDSQEAELGTNPNLADSDGDGFSDGQEVAALTDPTSASSLLRILTVTNTGTVTWESSPNVRYVVEVSKNLVDWTVVAEDVVGGDGAETTAQQTNPPAGAAYYRVGVK